MAQTIDTSTFIEGGLKQKEIAEKLGLSKGRVSQLVKELQYIDI